MTVSHTDESVKQIQNSLLSEFGTRDPEFCEWIWCWEVPVDIDEDTTDLGLEVVFVENDGEFKFEVGVFRIGPWADWEALSFGVIQNEDGRYYWVEDPAYPDWSGGWSPTFEEKVGVDILLEKIRKIFSIS